MRLLYIVQYFNFPDQTGSTRPYDLASAFVRHGYEVTVLTSDESGNAPKKWTIVERDGLKVYRLDCPYDNKMGFFKRIFAFCKFFSQASLKQFSLDYDVMLASSTPLTNGIPALFAKTFRKKPYIFEVRDVWPGVPIAMGYFKNSIVRKMLYSFEKRVYKRASAIVPLSIGMDANIKQRYPNDKSVVIPNISELNRFAHSEKSVDIDFPSGKKIILYAGTFGNVNGLSYVNKLAKETLTLDPDIWFYLIGKGKEKEENMREAEELGVLNNNVFFFNPVKKDDLPYLYRSCTAGSSFVIDVPALWDNSANKFFDTLAAKKPIIINHKGWQADTIQEKNIGYVLPPEITIYAAEEFVAYMNDAELLKEQGENGYKLAKEDYSLDVAVEKYMSIFRRFELNRSGNMGT